MAYLRAFLLSSVALLVLFVRSGESIRCWVCSSDVDRRCGDPFNMTHLAVIDCDRERAQSPYLQSIAMCKKTKQRVNNELITVRSCTWETDDYGSGPCSENSVSSYAKVEYCSTCNTDSCNSAESLSISAAMHGLLPLFAAISVSRYLTADN
ncbi:protein quiver-like [Macrosteles quadrilineatus]|uniref:protein quiver-like n=1 Tax=Macrosteles quadrilineatus TaxID=74068 RepID=UPI0023E32705|nr:protein quiver-like [Macrosteles quadrilineatus]